MNLPAFHNSAKLRIHHRPGQDSESQSKAAGPEPQYLDEFTSLLVPDDTRVMVDLLKLAVSLRSGERGKEVLSAVLSGMGTAYPQVRILPLDLMGPPRGGACMCDRPFLARVCLYKCHLKP